MTRLSRRALLRGAGVSLALPVLDAMVPSRVRASPMRPPKRLVVVFLANGFHHAAPLTEELPTDWLITRSGPAITRLEGTLAPLDAWKDQLTVVTGLHNAPGMPMDPHGQATPAAFTCCMPTRDGIDVGGPSIDQVAARVMQQQGGSPSRLRSLELSVERPYGGGLCGAVTLSCAYFNNISWLSRSTAAPRDSEPTAAFERLFSAPPDGGDAVARAFRGPRRKSVIDLVRGDLSSLRARLGPSDRARLDEYAASLQSLESSGAVLACPLSSRPGPDLAHPQRAQWMMDLTAMALGCDVTRVASVMVGSAASRLVYEFLGHALNHHVLSHREGDAWRQQLQQIEQWEMTQVAYLVEKLAAMPESDGTRVLDHTLILVTSEVSDGMAHNVDRLPVLMLGGGALGIPGGRVLEAPGTPLANFYLGMLDVLGVDGVTEFGRGADGAPMSTGRLRLT